MRQVEEYQAIQAISKEVLAEIGASLVVSDTEATIARRAQQLLADRGITDTWYHDCPALVLAGTRSCLSLSGRDYVPADEPLGNFNLVTVDLSPCREGIWGDCARSFYVENGHSVSEPEDAEFQQGKAALNTLHSRLQQFAKPDMSFDDLGRFMKNEIQELRFVELDFLSNYGHTIETDLAARSYIEKGNPRSLRSVDLFTFEPHIRPVEGRWGFKHEEIYYFEGEVLRVL
ncbi:M24 family metallopeptidase [Bremerella sp. JC817]|uniref:M24 family metallopeptidase n=1 Tax=Bremerella sp. JC817 TaxID=3231756 RepID=UPI00345AAFAD